MGLPLNPHGVLVDRRLRECAQPAGEHLYDPMHCIFAGGGVLQEEACLLLEGAKVQLRVGLKNVREYAMLRQGPHSEHWYGWKPADVFNGARAAAPVYTCTASVSELLTLDPHLVVLRGHCPVAV